METIRTGTKRAGLTNKIILLITTITITITITTTTITITIVLCRQLSRRIEMLVRK